MSDENVKKSSKRRKSTPREDMPLNELELDAIAESTRREMIEENARNPRHGLPDQMVCKTCAQAMVFTEGIGDSATGADRLLVYCSQMHGLTLGSEHNHGYITSCSSHQRIELPALELEQQPVQEG